MQDLDLEQLQQDIEAYVIDFCIDENIQDLRTQPQSIFNYLLRCLYKEFISKINLKSDTLIHKDNNIMKSTYNLFNYDLLDKLCDIYIYDLCFKYHKTVSFMGYSIFLNIDNDTITNWGKNVDKPNSLSYEGLRIFKKLDKARENGLSDLLQTGKNPVGIIAILNHEKKWNIQEAHELQQVKALSAAELPKLTSSERIEVVKVIDKQETPEGP